MKKALSEIARSLELAPDGIWRTRSAAQVSFPADGNRHCYAIEDESFWFEHRKRCLLTLLERFPPPGTLFDVGGGNGYLAAAFEAAGCEVVLIEPGLDGARNAQQRGLGQIICGRIEDAGFHTGSLPAIGLFDVLEHIQDDCGFLALCHRLQPAGGRLYLTVPASRFLWSAEDALAGHYRRYSPGELLTILEALGYEVEFSSYLFAFLLVPVFVLRTIPYRLGIGRKQETEADVRADHVVGGGFARRILDFFTQRELARIQKQKSVRTGTSVVVLARKRAR